MILNSKSIVIILRLIIKIKRIHIPLNLCKMCLEFTLSDRYKRDTRNIQKGVGAYHFQRGVGINSPHKVKIISPESVKIKNIWKKCHFALNYKVWIRNR